MSKRITTIMLAWLAVATALAGGYIECNSYSPDGKIYTFEVSTGPTDQWNSRIEANPPLSAKAAKDIATAFMKDIPLAENTRAWKVSTIALRQMSQEPEHWLYHVHFDAVPADTWTGPSAWFEVPVRMDGTIPTPTIKKQEKKPDKKE
jgi:hypothetical protein